MSNKYPGGFISLGGPTSSSVLFNGSNQYLSIPDNAALEVGSSDFTVEAWIYLTAAIPANGASVINKSNTGSFGPFSIGTASTGYLQFVASTSGSNWEVNLTDVTTTLKLGTWYHVAGCRSGSNFYLFKNGILVATGSNAGTLINNTETMKIAWVNYASTYFPGFLSNVRLVIGTALYTANFTPPTGALQNITNTALLTCQSSTIIDNSTANGGSGWTITNNNGAVVSAQTPFAAYNPSNLDPALGASTPGVWTLSQALSAEVTRSWPMYDPYYKNVVLSLHGEGTNGAQNNTFLDSSTNNFTITRNGNTTQGTFSPYGPSWSNSFVSANSDYQNIGSASNWKFLNDGLANWTVEFWINLTTTSARQEVISTNTNSVGGAYGITCGTNLTNAGDVFFQIVNGADGNNFNTATAGGLLTVGKWSHVAITFNASTKTVTIYVDGVLAKAVTSGSYSFGNSNPNYTLQVGRWIGSVSGVGGYMNGYISNLRMVNGSILYTSNFTPSTTPLTAISGTALLTCQSNKFVDNSSNGYAVTPYNTVSVQRFQPFLFNTSYTPSTIGGSGYFDGTGDYLSFASDASFAFGTGDFTVEGWAYLTATQNFGTLFLSSTTGLGNALHIQISSANKVRVTNDNTEFLLATNAITLNTWTHIAVVRSGTTLTIYQNGAANGTTTNSTNFTQSGALIGLEPVGGSFYYTGYFSSVRVNKGTAVYTGAFTPPTLAPLATSGASSVVCYPSTTNVNTSFSSSTTSLLTSMTNAGIVDNAMMNDLETVGNAQISTSVKKYGAGSMAFDGTGDYLAGKASPQFAFGTGDFTIECWVYPTSTTSYRTIFSTRGTPSSSVYFGLDTGSLYPLLFTAAAVVTSTVAVLINTWNHVALVRMNGTSTIYVNGLSGGSAADTTNYAGTSCSVGYDNGSPTYPWVGYIDDLRVTKGVARYMANFQPPTSQLQDQ